ncbi:MAG: hypothetical protein ICV55_06805 [Coleofasciculus sp. C3-bin4]|nr:hypothetical protein [Coleofasciculus sp. C3-bin4]
MKLFWYPKSLKGKVALFTFGSALALSSLAILARVNNSQGFVDARKVAPNSLIRQAISDNYLTSNGTIFPQVLKLNGEKELYIFDFNTRELCGAMGCLYAVYTREGKRVLSVYLKSGFPNKKMKLFSADGVENKFPCLLTKQFDEAHQKIVATRYCYQGNGLVAVFYQLLELS